MGHGREKPRRWGAKAVNDGRPSEADWLRMRKSYEDGASITTLSRRFGVTATTIRMRVRREDWVCPHHVLARLSRSFETSVAAVESTLADKAQPDAATLIKLVDSVVRLAERLRALRAACLAEDSADQDGAVHNRDELFEALERRLARLAEASRAACDLRPAVCSGAGEPDQSEELAVLGPGRTTSA